MKSPANGALWRKSNWADEAASGIDKKHIYKLLLYIKSKFSSVAQGKESANARDLIQGS
jgi:hypothetical protein